MVDLFLNPIYARWLSVAVRIIFALLIFGVYYQKRDKLSFYFALFFLAFGIEGILRNFAFATGIRHLYFADLAFFSISALLVLQGVEEVWDDWLKRFYVPYIFGAGLILLSVYNAYFAGGLPLGTSFSLPLFLFFALRGSVFFLSAYYINFIDAKEPHHGDSLVVGGLILIGITNLIAVFMMSAGLNQILLYLSTIATASVGIGWLLHSYK